MGEERKEVDCEIREAADLQAMILRGPLHPRVLKCVNGYFRYRPQHVTCVDKCDPYCAQMYSFLQDFCQLENSALLQQCQQHRGQIEAAAQAVAALEADLGAQRARAAELQGERDRLEAEVGHFVSISERALC